MHKTLIVAAVTLFAALAGCKSGGDGIPAAYREKITSFFVSRGGNPAMARIWFTDGAFYMTDGKTGVECYLDGDCRECGVR